MDSVRFIKGPVSLTEHIMHEGEAKWHIYVFGDIHSDQLNIPPGARPISTDELIHELVTPNDKMIDLFLEDNFPPLSSNSERCGNVENFISTLRYNLFDMQGPKTRLHASDVRSLDATGRLLQEGLNAIYCAMNLTEPRRSKLLSQLQEDWSRNYRRLEPCFGDLESIRKWVSDSFVSCKSQKQLDSICSKHQDILHGWWTSKLESFDLKQLELQTIEMEMKRLVSNPGTASKEIEDSLMTIAYIRAAIMDVYIVARMLRIWKGETAGVGFKRNIICYCGDAHASNQREMLALLGAKEVFRAESEAQCLDISKLNWPMFQ